MIRTAVIGAAGYTGIELVRWLCAHPAFELTLASSDGEAQKRLDALYPALLGVTEKSFVPHAAVLEAAANGELQLAFLAVPHTAAMDLAPTLLAKGATVIDLSADFRLQDAALYEQWYGVAHRAPELLKRAVYGLVELNRAALHDAAAQRAAGTAALVANPGCYPTASALAAWPALQAGLAAEGPLVINAISGVSGAGRKPTQTTHFCSASDDLAAYGATTHRHTPEIAQTLSAVAERPLTVIFTPHLAPLVRGMVSTVVIPLQPGVALEECRQAYLAACADQPFLQLLEPGQMPHSAAVAGTNNAHIGIAFDGASNSLVASCAIDNLGKGAAAQAVQSANLLFGLPEDSGLKGVAAVV
ncbi:MAG: N-acetyl-gamma-glutamyl-phosphate reductase [Coriobacteriales bacterium]|jgi:N-acetyl-gamma-glutamyl-phosphate reductase|nr:N-acetyl-gamma-glutamyl-phosphate reductase [Coriobacteriales bacterium]